LSEGFVLSLLSIIASQHDFLFKEVLSEVPVDVLQFMLVPEPQHLPSPFDVLSLSHFDTVKQLLFDLSQVLVVPLAQHVFGIMLLSWVVTLDLYVESIFCALTSIDVSRNITVNATSIIAKNDFFIMIILN
jgi:hypothetical protein